MKNITISLTAPQDSEMGKAILEMFNTRSSLTDLLQRCQWGGYPYHGGQHAFSFAGKTSEVISFLSLFSEEYPETAGDIRKIRTAINDGKTYVSYSKVKNNA